MDTLLAFDSFKESLSSKEAAEAFKTGFTRIFPEATCHIRLISDGGEGFVDAIIQNRGSRLSRRVKDPLGRPIMADCGLIGETRTAIIEIAAASGLERVSEAEKNPMRTSSYGTGELIRHCLDNKIRKFIIGIGGSATSDGGTGLLQALGARFFDKEGEEIAPPICGGDLQHLQRVDLSLLHPALSECHFTIANDVSNPLLGKNGAAAIFGPQKGADTAMVQKLENGLANFAGLMQQGYAADIATPPGSGAAGGIGGLLGGLFDGEMRSGIEVVMEAIELDKTMQRCDLVCTGEGRIDAQTVQGKTVAGIVKLANQLGKPVLAIGGGIVEKDLPLLYEKGVDAVLPIVSSPMALDDAIKNAGPLMMSAGEKSARLLKLSGRLN